MRPGARALLAAALLCAAASARAEVDTYDAGRDPGAGLIWSADGYHYAFFESSEGEDRWIVDGRVRAKGPEGALAGPGALNANGSLLLHPLAVFGKDGKPLGVAPAVNGRRIGNAYPEIQGLMLSPRGTNAAYVAKTPGGWAVVSQQGTGPSFAEPPMHLGITEKATLYYAAYGGGAWLYRDHRPVESKPYEQATASGDLRRTAGLYRSGPRGLVYVEVDRERFGPYTTASLPVFSANGRHFAFQARADLEASGNSYDTLIVDGRSAPMRQCLGCAVAVDDRGRAFQDVILTGIDERTMIHMAFTDGKSLHPGGQPPRVGLAPGGKHYVYPMLAPQGLAVGLDGKIAEKGAPMPLVPGPCAFDGEEYHYWSTADGKLYLACGSAEGPRAPKTRCASLARSLGWPRAEAVAEPASSPAR